MVTENETAFYTLLADAKKILEQRAFDKGTYFQAISPDGFEKEVESALNQAAKGTIFSGTIELIAGHKFPDISVGGKFGVEVKTAKSDHWKTLGNSVLESTRISGIDVIYIFFAKLGENTEFMFRKYQDCLEEVQITHSPRYMINMELKDGESIFAKMKSDYDVVRNQKQPISCFIEYYKSIYGNDTSIWWLNGAGQEKSAPMKISFWGEIDLQKKKDLRGYFFFLFPEVFSAKNKKTKYRNVVVWLLKNHSIVSTCVRDDFSAGGRAKYKTRSGECDVPQVIQTLMDHKREFKSALRNCDFDDIKQYLEPDDDFVDTIENRLDLWYDRFCDVVSGEEDYPLVVREQIKLDMK